MFFQNDLKGSIRQLIDHKKHGVILICIQDDSVDSHNLQNLTFSKNIDQTDTFPNLKSMKRLCLSESEKILFADIFKIEDISRASQWFIASDGQILESHMSFISIEDLEKLAKKALEKAGLRLMVGSLIMNIMKLETETACYTADQWIVRRHCKHSGAKNPDTIDLLTARARVRIRLAKEQIQLQGDYDPCMTTVIDVIHDLIPDNPNIRLAIAYPYQVIDDAKRSLRDYGIVGPCLLVEIHTARARSSNTNQQLAQGRIVDRVYQFFLLVWAWFWSLFTPSGPTLRQRHEAAEGQGGTGSREDPTNTKESNEYFGGDSTVYQGK